MKNSGLQSSVGELLLYEIEDRRAQIEYRFLENSLWLSQAIIAELYAVLVKTANEHPVNIFAENELTSEATIRKFRIVRREGSRQVARNIDHYNLTVILAVRYWLRFAGSVQYEVKV